MEPAYLTDARGKRDDAKAASAGHRAVSDSAKANAIKIAAENPGAAAELMRQSRDSGELADVLDTMSIPALETALREAETRAGREAVERESAEFIADDMTVETKLIPGIMKDAKALGAKLAALKAHQERRDAISARRKPFGLEPLLDAETRMRTVPGYVKPAVYRDEVVWRKFPGGPLCAVFHTNAAGESVPQGAGAVRSVEKMLVSREEHVFARHAESFVTAVVLPGLKSGDPMAWPPEKVTR